MISLFAVCALAGIVLRKSFINKDYLVDQIEDSINSDVEIGDIDFSILGSPANLTLKDVSFSPKGGGEAPVKIKELSVSVGLMDLFKKHIDVSSILIRGAQISAVFREDGSNSLEELFEDPDEETKKAKKKEKKKPSSSASKKEKNDGGGFNAFDQDDFVATLGRFHIVDSEVKVTIEETGLKLHCTDVNIDLSSIKVDPKKLNKTNSADLKIDLSISIESEENGHYGDLHLSGESQTTVFDPVTGDIEPNVMGDISLGDESWLNTQVPVVKEVWEKLDVLEKVGLKVPTLPEQATFGRSKAIAIHYHVGKLTFLKSISIWVGDWEIAALAESWLQIETDQHMIQAELLASETSSKRFSGLIEKGVKRLPREIREKVGEDIHTQLIRDDRILVAVQSSGDLSEPKVRPTGAAVDFKDSLKDAGKDYLKEKGKSLLKGLLKSF
ncbi:AsmA family protein [Akkermansiaceae bacterium]|nr:AsmA family protein [Akkermansiaceae bacterium]